MRRAAFPQTFAALTDVSPGTHALAEAHHVQALALLWLRAALATHKVLAAVQALQASARLRAAYRGDAPLLCHTALATARDAASALSTAGAARLAPRAREEALLAQLRDGVAAGSWPQAVADELCTWQTRWLSGPPTEDIVVPVASTAPVPPQQPAVVAWLQGIGGQATSFGQVVQQRLSAAGGVARGAWSESGDGGDGGSSTGSVGGGGRGGDARRLRQQGQYSGGEILLFREQVRCGPPPLPKHWSSLANHSSTMS